MQVSGVSTIIDISVSISATAFTVESKNDPQYQKIWIIVTDMHCSEL